MGAANEFIPPHHLGAVKRCGFGIFRTQGCQVIMLKLNTANLEETFRDQLVRMVGSNQARFEAEEQLMHCNIAGCLAE